MELDLLKRLGRLNLFKPISKHIREYFKDPRLIKLLEFPSLLLGAKPSNTPALYSIMNYADLSLGTWYPNGGIRAIATGLYQNALDHNVEFLFNHPVSKIETKENRLAEIEKQLTKEEVWSDLELSQKLSKEKTSLEKVLSSYKTVSDKISDSQVLLDVSIEENDDSSIDEISKEVNEISIMVEELEFSRMFTNKMDSSSAYIEIQAGSGGTEAQDWAEMLLRMYTKWAESRDFTSNIIEISHGEVAGIKSASLYVEGDYAYGWLRTETGIHRLVRKSPFDSGNRRHTSFASVFISPEVDDSIEINLNKADIRTYGRKSWNSHVDDCENM